MVELFEVVNGQMVPVFPLDADGLSGSSGIVIPEYSTPRLTQVKVAIALVGYAAICLSRSATF